MTRRFGLTLLIGTAIAASGIGCVTHTSGTPLTSPHYLAYSQSDTPPADDPFPLTSEPAPVPPPPKLAAQPVPPVSPIAQPDPLRPVPTPEKKGAVRQVIEFFAGKPRPATDAPKAIPEEFKNVPSVVTGHVPPNLPAPLTYGPSVIPPALDGTFHHDSEFGRMTMTFRGDKLHMKFTFAQQVNDKPVCVEFDTEFSLNKEGRVTGVIESVEFPDQKTLDGLEGVYCQQMFSDREGEPFTFRTKFEYGQLLVSDLRFYLFDTRLPADRVKAKLFVGKYTRELAKAPTPTVATVGAVVGPNATSPVPDRIPMIVDHAKQKQIFSFSVGFLGMTGQ